MKIGLFAPSSAVDSDELDSAVLLLKENGFSVRIERNILLSRDGIFAGSPESRADYFIQLVNDKSVDYIVCLRGGSGAVHLLNALPIEELLKSASKPVIGFSDATGLLNFLSDQFDWQVFHGPNMRKLEETDDSTKKTFFEHLKGSKNNDYSSLIASAKVIRKGTAKAKVAGGNLAVLASLCGTPWQVNFKEKILFLEDVAEAPYRIERMMSQLEYAGALEGVRGLLLGEFSSQGKALAFDEISFAFKSILGKTNLPVITDLPIGHAKQNQILPIGQDIELSTSTLTLHTKAF